MEPVHCFLRLHGHHILLLLAVMMLPGCSSAEKKTVRIGPYQMTFMTDPSPRVGFDAELRLWLRDANDELVTACKPRFRQYMPGMEMSHDRIYSEMKSINDGGGYQARSRQFSMGGDWLIEFELDCPEDSYTQQFFYTLEWPQ